MFKSIHDKDASADIQIWNMHFISFSENKRCLDREADSYEDFGAKKGFPIFYFVSLEEHRVTVRSSLRFVTEDNASSQLIGLASFSNFIIPQTALKEISFCDVFQFRWENRWGLRCLTNTLSRQALTRFSILSVCTEACSQLKVKTNIGVPTQTLPHNLSPPSAVTLI